MKKFKKITDELISIFSLTASNSKQSGLGLLDSCTKFLKGTEAEKAYSWRWNFALPIFQTMTYLFHSPHEFHIVNEKKNIFILKVEHSYTIA